MKTYKFENRTATITSERLLKLLSDNNDVDLDKDKDLTILYSATDILGNKIEGIEIDLIITNGNGLVDTYSLNKNNANPYNSKGFKYGKLCDVIGVCNPTSYWME